jgi:predicted Zn-dependent peptidase
VQEAFSELVYGDQPVGRPVIGNKKSVSGIKAEDLKRYRDQAHCAEATVVIVAGKFSESSAKTLVLKAFEGLPQGKKLKKAKVITKQAKPEILLLPKDSEQTHLVLGFRAFSARHKDASTLGLLTTLLGEGMSSRLFQKLREELGICYYVRASFDEYTDHGTFSVSAGVDPARSLEAISAILQVLKSLRDEGVSEEELQKAKEYTIGNLYLGLETADALAGYYGFDEIIRGQTKSPGDVEKEIRAITAKDITRLARKIFSDKGLNLAMVGKLPTKGQIKAILKIGA